MVLRQALRRDDAPLLRTNGWCANAELLARLAPHARRTDPVPAAARYDLTQRPSRVKPWHQLLDAWRARPIIRAARLTVTTLLLAVGAALTGGAMLRAQSDTTRTDTARARIDLLAPIGALVVAPAAMPFPMGERLVIGRRYRPISGSSSTKQDASVN